MMQKHIMNRFTIKLNAPLLKEVRKDMLDGKRHSMCVRCNDEDDAKMNSRRRNAIREYYLRN